MGSEQRASAPQAKGQGVGRNPRLGEAFFICRGMTPREWLALSPKARGSTHALTDAKKPKDPLRAHPP